MRPERCAICSGALVTAFSSVRDPQSGEIFTILRCTRCGLGHTAPYPSDIGRYYGETYFGGRHGMSERLCMARRLRFAKALGHGQRLLDFGCGDGGFLVAAANAGFEVMGVDFESRHARAKGVAAVEHLDEVQGTFDVITLWHSLEHVLDPSATMRELVSRVVKGGHIVVAVPNFASLQARCFGARWFHLDVPRHVHHFTRAALETLFAQLGLKPIRSHRTEGEIDLFGWTQSVLNTVFPSHPNVLFDVLTNRHRHHSRVIVSASLAIGTIATVMAAPLVPIASGMSRSAVLILNARKV